MTFDLRTVYHKDRPLSWSGISSFEWNPAQWHSKYVLKELPEETPELKFGKMVDERIQKDPTYLPQLIRYDFLQDEMRAEWDGIPLIGYSDTYREEPFALRDYKTGRKPWTQKRADETGQLTMYLFMKYMKNKKLKFENCPLYIDWLPTHYKDGQIAFIEEDHTKLKPVTFRTHRNMIEVLKFGQRITNTWKAMEEYATRATKYQTNDMKDW